MAKTYTSAFILLLAASLPGLAAGPRKAKCLLEVKGVHYIGGLCTFVPIDKRGSFRIVDLEGRGFPNYTIERESPASQGVGGLQTLAFPFNDEFRRQMSSRRSRAADLRTRRSAAAERVRRA
jgi:hypothetical protein